MELHQQDPKPSWFSAWFSWGERKPLNPSSKEQYSTLDDVDTVNDANHVFVNMEPCDPEPQTDIYVDVGEPVSPESEAEWCMWCCFRSDQTRTRLLDTPKQSDPGCLSGLVDNLRWAGNKFCSPFKFVFNNESEDPRVQAICSVVNITVRQVFISVFVPTASRQIFARIFGQLAGNYSTVGWVMGTVPTVVVLGLNLWGYCHDLRSGAEVDELIDAFAEDVKGKVMHAITANKEGHEIDIEKFRAMLVEEITNQVANHDGIHTAIEAKCRVKLTPEIDEVFLEDDDEEVFLDKEGVEPLNDGRVDDTVHQLNPNLKSSPRLSQFLTVPDDPVIQLTPRSSPRTSPRPNLNVPIDTMNQLNSRPLTPRSLTPRTPRTPRVISLDDLAKKLGINEKSLAHLKKQIKSDAETLHKNLENKTWTTNTTTFFRIKGSFLVGTLACAASATLVLPRIGATLSAFALYCVEREIAQVIFPLPDGIRKYHMGATFGAAFAYALNQFGVGFAMSSLAGQSGQAAVNLPFMEALKNDLKRGSFNSVGEIIDLFCLVVFQCRQNNVPFNIKLGVIKLENWEDFKKALEQLKNTFTALGPARLGIFQETVMFSSLFFNFIEIDEAVGDYGKKAIVALFEACYLGFRYPNLVGLGGRANWPYDSTVQTTGATSR